MSQRVTWSREAVLGSEIDEKRLKVGKVRVFFTESPDEFRVDAVLPRDKAYRTREPLESYGTRELSLVGEP